MQGWPIDGQNKHVQNRHSARTSVYLKSSRKPYFLKIAENIILVFMADSNSLSKSMIDGLPIPVPFRCVFQAQLLQNRVDLRVSEVELAEFTPDSLFLNNVVHQRPGFCSRLQVLVVAHLKNYLPDAFFGQFREAWMYCLQLFACLMSIRVWCWTIYRIGLDVNLASNVLDALNGLEMRDPKVLTA